ncbi:MAG: beta strand repeat-containing protein, partial [Dolichospermum sp.]
MQAQYTTPTVNGTIGASEYGTHTNGSNQNTNGSVVYMTWDATNLYVGVSGSTRDEALVLYLDKDQLSPVNSGSNANGTNVGNAYDGTNFALLPFRADLVLYVKNGYREYRTANGSNGWSAATTAFGSYSDNGSNVVEFSIPWSVVGGIPSSFNHFVYKTSSGGFVYAQLPSANAGGNIGTSARYERYYTISTTVNGTATKPFAQESYCNTQNATSTFSGTGTFFDFTVNNSQTVNIGSSFTVNNALHIGSGATLTMPSSGGAQTITLGSTSTNTPSLTCNGTLTPNNGGGNDLNVTAAFGTTTIAGSAANTAFRIFSLTVNNGATVQAPSSGTVDLGWQFGTITVSSGGILNFVNGSGVVNVTNNGATDSDVTMNIASTGSATLNNFTNNGATGSSLTLTHVSTNAASALSFNSITNNGNNTIIASSSGTASSAVPMTIRGNLTNSGTFTTLSTSNNRFLDITVTGSASILTSSVGISYRGLTIANTGSTSSNSLGVTLAGAGTVTIVTTRLLTVNSGARLILDVNTPLTLSTAPVFTVNGFFRRGVSTITGFSASTFIVNNGGVYEHNFPSVSSGTIPNATWNTGSTCTILASNNGLPTGLSQTFQNLTWNNTTQTNNIQFNGILTAVNGTFTVSSTGTGSIRLVASTDGTAYTATFGALSVTGGTLAIVGGGSAGTRVATINVTNDVTLSG